MRSHPRTIVRASAAGARRTRFWSVVALVTTSTFVAQSTALAYPADLHATRALVPDGSPGSLAAVVDAGGAVTLAIPIPTAPNRGAFVPDLALTYSSRNPLR